MADPRNILREYQPYRAMEYDPDAPQPTTAETFNLMVSPEADVRRGYETTTLGLQAGSLYRDADKLETEGRIDDALALREQARIQEETAAGIRPRLSSHTEVQNAGDTIDFLQSGFGQLAPTMGPPLAAGLAGGVAGGLVGGPVGAYLGAAGAASIPAFQMEAGEQASSQQADQYIRENTTAEERLREQNIKGAQNAALESLFPAVFGGRIVGNAARRIAGEAVRKGPLRRTMAVGREGAIESGTEFTQTLTGQASLSRLNPDRDTSHDYIEQIDSLILGALGGTSLSLGTTVPGYLTERINQRLGQAADTGARDLGRAAGELELRVIQDAANRGDRVGVDVPIRPSMMISNEMLDEADRAEFQELARRYQMATTAGNEESVRQIIRETEEFFYNKHPGWKPIADSIASREAIVEERGGDTLRINQETGTPTPENPDINMLPDRPIAMFPSTGSAGEAKFRRRHILTGKDPEDLRAKTAVRKQLMQWKREGFISESGMDAAQSKPLGQWLSERNASAEEVQAEADTMLRDIRNRLKGAKGDNRQSLLDQEAALKSAETYGDYFDLLNEYSVIEFPPSEIEGRFTPQDADQQRRSWELVTGNTPAEKIESRKALDKSDGIWVRLKTGGKRRILKRDVISHARNFFREELTSFPDGAPRDEAALLMGVFADPRVKAILSGDQQITQDTANLENPAHRAALKLDPPKQKYPFGKKPQDPVFSNAPEDRVPLGGLMEREQTMRRFPVRGGQLGLPEDTTPEPTDTPPLTPEGATGNPFGTPDTIRRAAQVQRMQAAREILRKARERNPNTMMTIQQAFARVPVEPTPAINPKQAEGIEAAQAALRDQRAQETRADDEFTEIDYDPMQKDIVKLQQLTAQRLRAEEKLAEARPGTYRHTQAEKEVQRLTNELTRWRDDYGAPLRPPEYHAIGDKSEPITQSPLTIPRGTQGPVTTRRPQAPPARDAEQAPQAEATTEFGKLPSYQEGQQTMTYAGVGARSTPAAMQVQMRKLATRLAEMGYTLNSGGAKGADSAFEAGAGQNKNIFKADDATAQTRKIASEVHPAWDALRSPFVRNLMARNTNQIFGANLDTPVDFVLAWTPDGAQTSQERSRQTGGTGQAIDMADRKGIPVINMAKEGWEQRLEEVLGQAPTADVSRGTLAEQGQEAWQRGLPEHTVDRTLQNADGSKRLASTDKDGNIRVNPVETVEEFYNYFQGQEGQSSKQKLKVLSALVREGWPRYKIRRLITTPGLANRFLVLHEQDHVTHGDRDVYWAKGGDLMTDDKIAIETRATKNALDQIQAEVAGGLRASKQIRDEKLADDIILGKWAKSLEKYGYKLVNDNGDIYVVDKDGNRVENKETKKMLGGLPPDMRGHTTTEEALQDEDIRVAKDAATRWLIRAFGPEIVDNMEWMMARDAPGGVPLAGYYDTISDFMSLAIDALDPLSTAFHEGMHKFVKRLGDSGDQDLYNRMVKAATAPHVMKQMEKLLADYPMAIEQMKQDPEEAVAYAFQFYAASRIPGGPQFRIQPSLKEFFTKLIESIKRMLGVMTHARASQEIFDALFEGRVQRDGIEPLRKYQERSFEQYAKDLMDGIRNSVPRALSSPIIQLSKQRNANGDEIPAFQKLANAWHSQPLKGGATGLIYRDMQMEGQYRNRWHKILTDNNVTEDEMNAALLNFQSMKPPRNKFERQLQHFFRRMHAYQFVEGKNPVKVLRMADEETGKMEWVTPSQVKNYWPRIWSPEQILANEIEFREVMSEEGDLTDEQITNFIEMLQATNGVEAGSELQQYRAEFSPYNAAINARVFDFINEGNAHRFAKFQEQNMAKVMDRYIRQAVHRREHSRTFGHDGKGVKSILAEAKAQGASEQQLAYAEKVVQGLEGRLGTDKVSDMQREAMVASMSITNFAVLAMATLSSMVDPLGVMVRTGSLKAAANTFKQGFAQVIRDARKTKTSDQELTEYLGIIEEDMVQDMLNNMERGIYMNEKLRKLNKFFFKSIGLEQWTRGTRVGAMRASLEYLKKHKNDTKRLEELNLTPDLIEEMDDRIKIKPEEFNPENPGDPAAIEKARRVQNAVFRMVDESVLRPSAATRPLWASDMRFRLLGHLKSYTFTFHNQILRQVVERAKNGENLAQSALAFMPLLAYVPVMLAADMARDMIKGDDRDRDWDETLSRAIQRSAILGMGTFAMDVQDDMAWGNAPTNTVLGPVIDSTLDIGGAAVNPDRSFLNAASKMLPYNAMWRNWGDEDEK